MSTTKRCLRSGVILVLVLAMLVTVMPGRFTALADSSELPPYVVNASYSEEDWQQIPDTAVPYTFSTETGDPLTLGAGESTSFVVNLPAAGPYEILVVCRPVQDLIIKGALDVDVNGVVQTGALYSLWQDASAERDTDRFGHEIMPEQQTTEGMVRNLLKSNTSLDQTPLRWEMQAGDNAVTITSANAELVIESVYCIPYEELPSFESYKAGKPDTLGTDDIHLEAERSQYKSDSYIQGGNKQDPGMSPYHYQKRYINVLSEGSFNKAGQKVMWAFRVESAGWYTLSFSYTQTTKEDMTVYRNIEIDGAIPFQEYQSVGFAYTGMGYEMYTCEYPVWLDAGDHTLALEAEGRLLDPYVGQVQDIMEQISAIGVEMRKIANASSDTNRTWDIESYMPGVTEQLHGLADQLSAIYIAVQELQGEEASAAVNLKKAGDVLLNILKKPEKMPARLDDLTEGSGSVLQLLADLITLLQNQPVGFDRIYVSNSDDLPPAEANFFRSAWDSIRRFFYTLFNAEDKVEISSDITTLNVWVNRPIQYVETMQNLADSMFTPEYGIQVNFSVMPDENKLVLSNASGTSPDVAMSLASHTPYNLASRTALKNLLEFPDFEEYVSQDFNLETLTPYVYDDGIYGMTETQDFYVTFYRTDIFDNLGLEPPKTWDDVKQIMTILSRNSMNFNLPLSGWTGTKPLYTTMPFLYQAGGDMYTPDGLSAAIQSEEAIAGFTTLVDLYTKYSVQQQVSNFYNSFRYGTIPAGVGSFNTYVQLLYAAPELAGKWAIAPSPGMVQEDGSINNVQPAADRACVIFESSPYQAEAWTFLKWWLSADVQTKFGYTLQTRYGVEYMWNTANMTAFANLQLPEADKAVILEQWDNMKEINRHPAAYMMERELSNAWNSVVTQGMSPRVALDEAANIINREITRKMEEFGYLKDGVSVKEYHVYTVQELLKGGMDQ